MAKHDWSGWNSGPTGKDSANSAATVCLAEFKPARGSMGGHVPDGLWGFEIKLAEIVDKTANAKTPGRNLHLRKQIVEPADSEYVGVEIESWHGIPLDGTHPQAQALAEQMIKDERRLDGLFSTIKSATPGSLEQATAPGAAAFAVTPGMFVGRRGYARFRTRIDRETNRPLEPLRSEVAVYVPKAEFDARPGPDGGVRTSAPTAAAQARAPEIGSGNASAKPTTSVDRMVAGL